MAIFTVVSNHRALGEQRTQGWSHGDLLALRRTSSGVCSGLCVASTRPLKKLLTGSKEWGTGWHDSPRLICCCICWSAAAYAQGHVGLRVAGSRVPASTTVPRNKPSQRALAPPGRGTSATPGPAPGSRAPRTTALAVPPTLPPRGRRQADCPCPEVAHHLERDPEALQTL